MNNKDKEIKKSKFSVTELGFLKHLNKKQKIGAVLSAVIALLCMYGLYNMEFTVDVNNTDSFEVAIDEYFFNDSVDVSIINSGTKHLKQMKEELLL